MAVLTGGPGCGKSFTVKSVITLAAAKRAKIVLAAPTGRAAKRLTELSGHPATTVHRLLQLRPGGDPSFDRDNPIDADLIVVDEASMLDLILANKLIKAVPPGSTCCWSAMWTSCPRSAPGRCCATCLHIRDIARRMLLRNAADPDLQDFWIAQARRIQADLTRTSRTGPGEPQHPARHTIDAQ